MMPHVMLPMREEPVIVQSCRRHDYEHRILRPLGLQKMVKFDGNKGSFDHTISLWQSIHAIEVLDINTLVKGLA